MIKFKTSLLLYLLLMTAVARGQDASEPTSPADDNGSVTFEDFAPEEGARPKPMRLPPVETSTWDVGVMNLQWNENLTVTQSGVKSSSNMSLNGAAISADYEKTYMQWGWSAGGMIGAGRANSGPFANNIKVDREKFSFIGITPRAFWRISDRINIGGTAMIYYRKLDLPTDTNVSSSAGKETNLALLLDMNLRLFDQWDFYQAIGPVADNAYLWKIGVNYRF